MITSKQIITVTRDDPRFDMVYEALKERGFRMDEDTVSVAFTKSDIYGPIYSFYGEMTKLNEDDEQIESTKLQEKGRNERVHCCEHDDRP